VSSNSRQKDERVIGSHVPPGGSEGVMVTVATFILLVGGDALF
jgi:hypothetical protein